LEIRLSQLVCVMRYMWGKARVLKIELPHLLLISYNLYWLVHLCIDDSFLKKAFNIHLYFFHFSFIFFIFFNTYCQSRTLVTKLNFLKIIMDCIRLVMWLKVARLWRKGYKGSKFIYELEKFNKYCKQSSSFLSFFFLFSNFVLLFFSLFFLFLFFIFSSILFFFYFSKVLDVEHSFLIILLLWIRSFHTLFLWWISSLGSFNWVSTCWSLLRVFFERKIIFGSKRVQKMCRSVWDEETWSYIISNHDCLIFQRV